MLRPLASPALLVLLLSGVPIAVLADSPRAVDPQLETVAQGTEPMPRLLPPVTEGGVPRFVAADRVLLPDGTIDPTLFRPGDVLTIQRYLDAPPQADCIHLDFDDSGVFPALEQRMPLSQAVKNRDNVLVGEVTGRIYGYRGTTPGTLLRVETQEIFRGQRHHDRYFVHFPAGSFHLGPHRLCRTTSGFPAPPELGDRLLLLYDDLTWAPTTEFLYLRTNDLVVLPKHGPISYSRFFGKDSQLAPDWNSEQFLGFVGPRQSREKPDP